MGLKTWQCLAFLSCYFVFGWMNVSEFRLSPLASLTSEKSSPSESAPQLPLPLPLLQQQQHHHPYNATLEEDILATTKAIMDNNPMKYITDNQYGVVGVLSSSAAGYQYKRMAQRATWVKDAPLYNVKVYFLIDRPDPGLDKEQALYGDLVYINATYSGRAVRFGEKLYLWYKLAHALHPDAAFVAKVDDDCVVCSNVMWPFVWDHVTPTSYLGWMHNYNKGFNKTNATEAGLQIGSHYRMDEFFVVVGQAIVERLAKRRYCHTISKTCNNKKGLIDTNFGGKSLALWLHPYRNLLNVTTLNDISQHPSLQFPMVLMKNRNPMHYVCPRFPYVHYVKDPLAHSPIYNNSAQPIRVEPVHWEKRSQRSTRLLKSSRTMKRTTQAKKEQCRRAETTESRMC
jgi:Galactosyltransferase